MADPYVPLRERLRRADPELSAELDLQWKIATNEWLPAISSTEDSSNNYPHIRNIENHMDAVLSTLSEFRPSAAILDLPPIEIYLLLASALFHDIGKADDTDIEHGERSREYIIESHDSLGIRNREVARSLGNICACHSRSSAQRLQAERNLKLWDIVIDPYGEVRQRMIAAMLTLADHMDCAQTRVIPDYLRKEKYVLGGFRNIIQGVFADPSARLIRTVLVTSDEKMKRKAARRVHPTKGGKTRRGGKRKGSSVPPSAKYHLNKSDEIWRSAVNKLEISCKIKKHLLERSLESAFIRRGKYLELKGDSVRNLGKPYINMIKFPPFPGFLRLDFAEKLISWNILQVNNPSRVWKRETLLAIVLSDLRSNRDALQSIRDNLAAVGLPLATWLVDHAERLYLPNLHETYEPRFHKGYLIETARAMWELSRRVIGTSEFTYAELASHIGYHDIPKVRMAAKRLAIIAAQGNQGSGTKTRRGTSKSRKPTDSLPWSSPIWIGDHTWKWRVGARQINPSQGCTFLHVSNVLERIIQLSEPEDHVVL